MKIRNIDINDSLDILNWRNDSLSISMSLNANKISSEEHSIWFNNALNDPQIKIYIGEIENFKVGVCRFDYDPRNDYTLVSINLNPLMRGTGVAYDLLQKTIIEYRTFYRVPLKAEIKRHNVPSIRIFEKCNFQKISTSGDYHFYELI